MEIKIERYDEYEAHVKRLATNKRLKPKEKRILERIALQAFKDGMDFAKGNLKVEIKQ
jgi:hypothetical protein